ncbi:hypothetical protein [Streptomyces sp. LN785]|uniref:hypothetical protein n=1 Tax=Streptomyces sp. LN785 TaxID=3112983 RepID=UPI003715475A
MNVDDIVAAKIEAARRQVADRKRIREELAAARKRGLAHRYRVKLAYLDQLNNATPAASAA